jgi:hypothetical protein
MVAAVPARLPQGTVMATDERIDTLLDQPFTFRERPSSVPSDLRPVWRVPVVILLVQACRGSRATPEQLHVLNWAVRSTDSAATLSAYLAGELGPSDAVVRFEPALDRAVALARGYRFLRWNTRYWVLTADGRAVARLVESHESLLQRERTLLATLPRPLTQAAVEALLHREQG